MPSALQCSDSPPGQNQLDAADAVAVTEAQTSRCSFSGCSCSHCAAAAAAIALTSIAAGCSCCAAATETLEGVVPAVSHPAAEVMVRAEAIQHRCALNS